MTAARGGDNRDLVPRWRPFLPTTRTGELAPTDVHAPRAQLAFDLPAAITAFAEDPGLYTAGDLLGQSIVSGRAVAEAEVAALLIREEDLAGPAAQALADHFLADRPTVDDAIRAAEPFSRDTAIRRAREMRRIVRAQPRNAVRWTDLALVHVNLGQLSSAAREMGVATSLAPDNRFVLRSAARLHVLLGNPDRGLDLLRKSDSLDNDPWLQSAEIALSELVGQPSRRIRAAKKLIERASLSPFHLSELAGEVATAELRHGSTRSARRFMRTALIDPTDNSVAQAEWASQHGIENPNPSSLDLPRSFEARALDLSSKGEYSKAVVEALKWQSDQPFDADAGIFVSYTATVLLERYDLGIAAARQALIANPQNSMLLNNLVFGLASDGHLEAARTELTALNLVEQDARQTATVAATRGLVAFRMGDPERGRAHYRRAIEELAKLGDRDFSAMAAVFLAREELKLGTVVARTAVEDAVKRAENVALPEARVWVARLVQRAADAGIFTSPEPPRNPI